MDATIVIGIFGDVEKWFGIAKQRAIPSAVAQGCSVVISYGDTLASARNAGAEGAMTEWLIFLDADDELEDGYVEAILGASGDLRAPAVSWVTDGVPQPPVLLDDRDIEHINPCVIGTAIRSNLFETIGGFKEWRAWEDYALFLSAYRLGATIEHVPGAVYRVTVRPESRNNTIDNPGELFQEIHLAAAR